MQTNEQNASNVIVYSAVELSESEQKVAKMREYLDNDNLPAALGMARSLMHSADHTTRAMTIDVLAWIGKKALPQLAELTKDSHDDIAQDAYMAWERVLDEVDSERVRTLWIVDGVKVFPKQEFVESALLLFSTVDKKLSLPALEGIVLEYKGNFRSSCAKEMYAHIAGEPWMSSIRTSEILKKEDRDESERKTVCQ